LSILVLKFAKNWHTVGTMKDNKKKQPKVPTRFILTERQMAWLRGESERRGASMSQVLRDAVDLVMREAGVS
jgi:hypothetical protein